MVCSKLILKRLGIDTYKQSIVYMHKDADICLSEGFEVYARVLVKLGDKEIIATLNMINSNLLQKNEVGLSEYAWSFLEAKEGEQVTISHSDPVKSLSFVRSKIYGNKLSGNELRQIITDISQDRYSDIHISSFLTTCAGDRIDGGEILNLTKAMIEVGDKLSWHSKMIVDKHCVGGLPGNRTTPIVVAIVAAYGLTMPKTSSRAITSSAGTADTMEVFTSVDIGLDKIKQVVGKENGCVAWGGAVSLSPADDILIRVEKSLELDSEGQLVASVLSKKIAAGSTHILIDIPIGKTAKVRTKKMANLLKKYLVDTGKKLGVFVKVVFTDGSQPVGNGVGPVLEANDIEAVLKCQKNAPQDLTERALFLAGNIIEFSKDVKKGQGYKIAKQILESKQAWHKFVAICKAQGAMKKIPVAKYQESYKAKKSGKIIDINNRKISLIAKLAGAPQDKEAGIYIHKKLNDVVNKGDKIFTIHARSKGELDYALNYLNQENNVFEIV